jgi:biotin carboxyl carrier protein
VAKREIRTPVGGSVWTHSTAVGQRVVAGTTLLICEVMKCEYPIETPVDAVVSWLKPCGETIETDDVVALIEVA